MLKYWSEIINLEIEKGKFVNCIHGELNQLSISEPGIRIYIRVTLFSNLGGYWQWQTISGNTIVISL